MLKTLFAGAFGKLRTEAAFLVLLAVAGVGAWLYVELRHAVAARDRLTQWAAVTCASAGEGYARSNGAAAGVRCADRVVALARFKASADEQTAQLLADALREHDARQQSDNLAARAAAEAAKSAAQRMEAADAEAERKNLVDREWFAAVNGVAGLRPSRR